MSLQSDAAKAHIEKLFNEAYPQTMEWAQILHGERDFKKEYQFRKDRRWRFDYAVPALLCANYLSTFLRCNNHTTPPRQVSIIEIDGGTFKSNTGHNSGIGLRAWREKNNAAMSLGWRVWHYAPEEIIKAGRKTLPDEPILKRLPWL